MPRTETLPEMTAEERTAYLEAELAKFQARNAELEAAQEHLAVRRAASVEEPENEQVTIEMEKQEARHTNHLLKQQATFSVFIPMDQRDKREVQTEAVQINGADKYVIVRGEDQIVPESVYLVLVEAGMVRPQREQDISHSPRVSVRPGLAAALVGG